MRKNGWLLLLVSATAMMANGQDISRKTLDNFAKLSWLEGTWTNVKNKPGETGHERWLKSSPTAFRGYGVTMKGIDTVFVEKLRIVIKDDDLYYVADVPENQKSVFFKLAEVTSNSFVCENPQHDFPKKIEYYVENGHLNARISGDGKTIDFHFQKK